MRHNKNKAKVQNNSNAITGMAHVILVAMITFPHKATAKAVLTFAMKIMKASTTSGSPSADKQKTLTNHI